MKKSFLLVAVLLLVGAGCSTTSNTTIDTTPTGSQTNTDTSNGSGSTNDTNTDAGATVDLGLDVGLGVGQDVVDITVVGAHKAFDVKEIRIKKGDIVRLTFKNDEGKHDWQLEGYNVGTKELEEGKSETVEFTADKTGTFEYYCSVGEHREMGMVGKLIVE
ncbi:MAG: cupredoxin domain-containing protein [Candidatus Magasanikbacteria bacterium]|nr:cupredoxin domain-containing protein [Candidatus Magasanikbacteria bacterium]